MSRLEPRTREDTIEATITAAKGRTMAILLVDMPTVDVELFHVDQLRVDPFPADLPLADRE